MNANLGFLPDVSQLVLRAALAVPFWQSGRLKWDGFLHLNDTAILLFSSQFQLHLPGGPYAFPWPDRMAFATGLAELCLPVLLLLGVATRLSAALLLCMVMVIELTIPAGWPIHLTWAAMALSLAVRGAGRFSVDHLFVGRGR